MDIVDSEADEKDDSVDPFVELDGAEVDNLEAVEKLYQGEH